MPTCAGPRGLTKALREPSCNWTRAKVAQLEAALEHRTVLGQATGIVMTRYGLDSGAAFQVLSRLSQDLNRKVYDIALEMVHDHDAEALTAEAEARPHAAS